MLHSECNKEVPFFCHLFFRVPPLQSSIEWSHEHLSMTNIWTRLLVKEKQNLSICAVHSSVFRGGAVHSAVHSSVFWRDTLLKMGFQTYIFWSKVLSKCRKCGFRDPNFKKFSGGGGMPPDPLQLCRYYGLPLTKILANKRIDKIDKLPKTKYIIFTRMKKEHGATI